MQSLTVLEKDLALLDVPKVTRNSSGVIDGFSSFKNELVSGKVPTYTWLSKPSASSNLDEVICISDIGSSSIGSLWKSDGTQWVPLNNRTCLAKKVGSIASPIATYSGTVGGLFVVPSPNKLTIPAGVIPVGASLNFELMVSRGTSIVNANEFSIRIGTTGTTSDSAVYGLTIAATANQNLRIATAAHFNSATSYTTSNWGGVNTSLTNSFVDRTSGNINTALDMIVSFTMGGATFNASDVYSLIAYSVWLEV